MYLPFLHLCSCLCIHLPDIKTAITANNKLKTTRKPLNVKPAAVPLPTPAPHTVALLARGSAMPA